MSNQPVKLFKSFADFIDGSKTYWEGMYRYVEEFADPCREAIFSFNETENRKLLTLPPHETVSDYMELFLFNLKIAEKGFISSFEAMSDFQSKKINDAATAWFNTFEKKNGNDISDFFDRQSRLLQKVVHTYPEKIEEIKNEYGFHFDTDGYKIADETDRFFLYQVMPTDKNVTVRKNGKPVIIIPPYVLSANILAFLPKEHKSYVHAFANLGIPTYIRIVKDIATTPAVQTMTGEDGVIDIKQFCETLKKIHGRQVTLNGFCQGGFIATTAILSGELDGLTDTLITCVAPMDGTRSKSLVEYLKHIPPRFRDLGYAIKKLPNGNTVVDGKVMNWVYKLKSMEKEAPIFTYHRDIMMFERISEAEMEISKTAAALNHWMIYDRTDLPVSITKMSFDSYTIPVGSDGTLPFKLFNRKLNFRRLAEKKINVLICYAEKDDLVDKEAVLAPLDYIDAEVTIFPKGHAAIATSWSNPDSECSITSRFGDNYRGPALYHLETEKKGDLANESKS